MHLQQSTSNTEKIDATEQMNRVDSKRIRSRGLPRIRNEKWRNRQESDEKPKKEGRK